MKIRAGNRYYELTPDGYSPELEAWVVHDDEGHLVTIPDNTPEE